MPPRTASERDHEIQRLSGEVDRLDQWQVQHDDRCAERYEETRDALKDVRGDIRDLREQVIKAIMPAPLAAAGASGDPPTHDGGLPYKHGWRSWLVVSGAAVAALAALRGAVSGGADLWHACHVAFDAAAKALSGH